MISKRLFIRGAVAAVAVGIVAASAGAAEAATFRRCPDGTMVADSERCPPKAIKMPGRGGSPTADAPKPKDPPKKWKDYIFEDIKVPKPAPKR